MKITCNRNELADLLSKIGPVVQTKSPNEAYRNVHVVAGPAGVKLTACDGEMSVTGTLASAKVTETMIDETLLIPHARLSRISRDTTGDELSIISSAKQPLRIAIKCGGGEFELQLSDSAEFVLPKSESTNLFGSVAGKVLLEGFAKVVYCCDLQSTRYSLGGVNLNVESDRFELAATDSRRLGVVSIPSDSPLPAMESNPVIPAKAVRTVMSAISETEDVDIAWSSRLIVFESDSASVSARLVEGRFPRYQNIIPATSPHSLSLPRASLLSAVRQAMIVTNEESRGIEFAFGDGELNLQGVGKDVGKSSVRLPISWTGETVNVSLNPQFVIECLKTMTADSVDLSFTDTNTAFLIEEPGNKHVVMPLSGE